jgi:hypothetical protein
MDDGDTSATGSSQEWPRSLTKALSMASVVSGVSVPGRRQGAVA